MNRFKAYLENLKLLVLFVAAIWIVYAISIIFMPLNIQQYGLQPRKISGLIGIATAPFLHVGPYHLIANTLGIIIFGVLFTILKGKNAFLLIVEIAVLQGLALWVLGRSGNHVGASGLVFGLFGYLLFAGYFQRKILHVLVSLFVLLFYSGMIFGVLPTSPFVSWEGHLLGFVVGIIEAKQDD